MSNPATKLESLLRQHGFKVVRETRHIVYRNPEGKIFVTSKTPSDHRAVKNMVSTLERVIASPAPSSELIEEESQRREIEKTITLTVTVKPLAGMSGAGKGKKQRGVGIYYEEKLQTTAEELALREENRQRALANKDRKEAQKRERREERREREEWSKQLSRFRKTVRQFEADRQAMVEFLCCVVLYSAARISTAEIIRGQRSQKPKGVPAEVRKAADTHLLDRAIAHTWEVVRTSEEMRQRVTEGANALAADLGALLLDLGGRFPSFMDDGSEPKGDAPARVLRQLRFAAEQLGQSEQREARMVFPQWLRHAVLRLRPANEEI